MPGASRIPEYTVKLTANEITAAVDLLRYCIRIDPTGSRTVIERVIKKVETAAGIKRCPHCSRITERGPA